MFRFTRTSQTCVSVKLHTVSVNHLNPSVVEVHNIPQSEGQDRKIENKCSESKDNQKKPHKQTISLYIIINIQLN